MRNAIIPALIFWSSIGIDGFLRTDELMATFLFSIFSYAFNASLLFDEKEKNISAIKFHEVLQSSGEN